MRDELLESWETPIELDPTETPWAREFDLSELREVPGNWVGVGFPPAVSKMIGAWLVGSPTLPACRHGVRVGIGRFAARRVKLRESCQDIGSAGRETTGHLRRNSTTAAAVGR